jgi:gluconokinase
VRFVHVHGDRAADRLSHRAGHFFPASLLDTQLAALEPLGPDEDGVVVDVALGTTEKIDLAMRGLGY